MNLDRKKIRPLIKGISTISNKSNEEAFQNETLRPIIKLQHNLLVAYFQEYLKNRKCVFTELSNLEQRAFVEAAFKRDSSFKSEIKGLIIGHFTTDEFIIYSNNKSDFNKRILTMIQQRLSGEFLI
jgi:hypothetical protein